MKPPETAEQAAVRAELLGMLPERRRLVERVRETGNAFRASVDECFRLIDRMLSRAYDAGLDRLELGPGLSLGGAVQQRDHGRILSDMRRLVEEELEFLSKLERELHAR